MEQEIIVFEAPPREEAVSSVEEKYTVLGRLFPKSIVDAVHDLDQEESENHFDSTVPALMVQEIMKYFYPIWDRLDERKQSKTFSIKIPLRKETFGYYVNESKRQSDYVGKAGASADVVGFRVPKFTAPQRRFVYNPMWEEVFRFPPLCNAKYIILNGRFGQTLISAPHYYVQQTKDFPHVDEYPGDIIKFTDTNQAVAVMNNIIQYRSRLCSFYEGLSVYHMIKCGSFKRFLGEFYKAQPMDLRTEQIYGKVIEPVYAIDKGTGKGKGEEKAKPQPPPTGKIDKSMAVMLDLCNCSFPDLTEYTILGPIVPINKRDSWWMSLDVHRLSMLYILLIQGSPLYSVMLDKVKSVKLSNELKKTHRMNMTRYQEAEAIKLFYARSKFKIGSLSLLKPAQLKIVEKEYEAYLSAKQVPREISKAIRQFQMSMFGPIEILAKTFATLKHTISITDTDIYEKYVLCPHRVDLAKELLAGKAKRDAVETIKQKYAVADLIEYYGFFCSTCGEMVKRLDTDEMMEFIDFGDIYQGTRENDDPLGGLIDKIVLSIVNHDLMFTGVTKLLRIVDYITNVIYPRVAEMDKQLSSSKTTLPEHRNDLLSIYIHIYTMAIAVRMVAVNPDSISFVGSFFNEDIEGGRADENIHYRLHGSCTFEESEGQHWSDIVVSMGPSACDIGDTIGGKPRIRKVRSIVSKALPVAQLIAMAKKILLKNITGHMRKVNAIKPEALTGLLVKAYQWAATLKESKRENEALKHKLSDTLINIPTYIYLYDAHVFAGEKIDIRDFKAVLGRTEAELDSGTVDIFANAPIVDKWVQRKDLDEDSLDYQYRSYLAEIRYAREGIYRLTAAPDIVKSQTLIQFENEFADLTIYESYRGWRKFLFRLFPLAMPDISKEKPASYYDPSNRKLNYAQYYDSTGKPRKWNTYIYETSKGKKVTIDAADIAARAKTPEFADLKFVDWGNTDGDRFSTVADSSIEDTVKMQFSVQCLFEYYNSRCPEGDLHVIEQNQCTRCKMGSVSREAYYKRYKHKYRELIVEQSAEENEMLASMNTRIVLPDQPKLAAWKSSADIILKWSKVSKIEFSKLNAIGMYWRCMEEEIASGKCDPLHNVTEDDQVYRVSALVAHYMYIVRLYGSIKYDAMVHMSDIDLGDVFTKHKDSIGGIHNVMPSINSDLVFLQIERELDVAVKVNFILSTIANLLLQIEQLGSPKTDKYRAFGHDIFMFITNRIIKTELASTKPPPYNRAAIKPTGQVINQYDDSDNEIDDDLTEAYDENGPPVNAPIAEEPDDGNTDIFSFGNSDIATANNGNDDGDESD